MSVQRLERKGGVRWIVRYRDRSGVQRQESYTAKADADRRDREVKREIETGAPVGEGRSITLRQYVVDRWAPEHADQVAPKTRQGYLHAWRTRIKPSLGDVPLAKITVRVVKQWQADQVSEARRVSVEKQADHLVGQVAIERARTVLSSILSHAAEEGLIAVNPVANVRKLKGKRDAQGELRPPGRLTIPDPLQVERIRLQLDPRDSALVAVLAYAGLRPGEAWRLQWADLEGDVIRVWARKTDRVRHVPVRDPLSAFIEQWRAEAEDTSPGALVFPGRDGQADHRAWVAHHWKPAVKAAGYPVTTRPYDLRHGCASLLVAEQRSVIECAEWMGHSAALFLGTYAHVLESLRGKGKVDVDAEIRKARAEALSDPVCAFCARIDSGDAGSVEDLQLPTPESPGTAGDW